MTSTHFLPLQRHPVVDRNHVIEHALHGNPALIMLRAGRGYGKSIAATQIAKRYVAETPESDAVWVRFGRGQIGFESVWRMILSTLLEAELLPTGSGAEDVINGGPSSTQPVIEVLQRRATPLMIVFDDAHESVTPDVETSLLEVLESVPSLTVVITTRRRLPGLVSLQARMRVPVRKLTKEQLCLSKEEVSDLVRLRALNEAQVKTVGAQIFEESRGWPFAVHALLVEHEATQLNNFTPIDKKPKRGSFVNELLETTLKKADPLAQKTLVAVALFGEMSEAILAKVLQVSVEQFRSLTQTNLHELLDYWTDEEGTNWYTLHDLIAENIRSKFSSSIHFEERKSLAKRAASAYRSVRPRLALQAAILAEDWELLSELLLTGTAITLSREQQPANLSNISETVRDEYPVIAAFALIYEYAFPTGRLGRALTAFKMRTSRSLATEAEKPSFSGLTAAVLRMIIARLSGDEKTALEMAGLANEKMGTFSDSELEECGAVLQIGVNQIIITALHTGYFMDAMTLLRRLNVWEMRLEPKSRAHATALAAWVPAYLGEMNRVPALIEACEEIGLPLNWHDSYIGFGYRVAAALMELEKSNIDEAQRHLSAIDHHRSTIEHWPFLIYVEVLTAELVDGAHAALNLLEMNTTRKQARKTTSSMRHMLRDLEARLSWQSGRVLPRATKQNSRSVRAAYAALSRGENALAATILATLAEQAFVKENPRLQTEILLLRAETALRLEDSSTATIYAHQTLKILNKYHLTLPLRSVTKETAEALRTLVPEFPTTFSSPAVIRKTIPLTPAEKRTLSALATHATIRETAETLFLSPDTVKGYCKSIYRKLGVNSREQALSVATKTGLLSEDRDEDD